MNNFKVGQRVKVRLPLGIMYDVSILRYNGTWGTISNIDNLKCRIYLRQMPPGMFFYPYELMHLNGFNSLLEEGECSEKSKL